MTHHSMSLLFVAILACSCGDKSSDAASSSSAKSSASGPSAASSAADSAAPAPPDGVLGVAEADKVANSSPESVTDKKVKVTGVVGKVGKQTAGKSSVTHFLRLTTAKDSRTPSVHCDLGKTEPAGVEEGATVTVEGTGRLSKVTAEDGTIKNHLELRDCAIGG